MELGQGTGLIWDRAQHQGGDGGVHAGVRRRESVGAAVDHPDRNRRLAGGDLGKAAQIRLGLHSEDLGDGRTRLHAQSLTDSFEGRDQWLASGMETGVDEGYAKLDALVAELR